IFALPEIASAHESNPHRVQKLRIDAIARVLAAHPVRAHVEAAPRLEPDLRCRFDVRPCGGPRTKLIEIRLRGRSPVTMRLEAGRKRDEMAVVEAGIDAAKALRVVDEQTGHDEQQTADG